MTFKELRELSGMTRPEFAKYFCIPYRTVQSWELGDRSCPKYVLRLIEYKLRKENIIKDLIRADIEKHAADVVAVVRCKDCKYYTDLSPYDRGECSYYENLDLYCPERDGYCSCGVAKMDK